MNREDLIHYSEWFRNFLVDQGVTEFWATLLNTAIIAVVGFVLILLLDILVRKIIVQLFKAFSNKTKTSFDDFLVQSNFPKYIAHIVPWSVLWIIIPIVFNDYPKTANFFATLAKVYLVILGVYIIRSILRSIKRYLR